VLQTLKQFVCFAMSSSTMTYFSNGTTGSSTSSGPLGYWSNQNYNFYQHYAYQNVGGIVHPQFPYQQHHIMTENGDTVYQPHENESSPIQAPIEDQNATNTLAPSTKYSTNLSSVSYTSVGLSQQQISRKPASSPSSLQSSLNISDECFPIRYNLNSSTQSMFQTQYQQANDGLRSPQPEARNIHITGSPPRRTDHDQAFPPINQQSVVDVKKEATSPILGMLLNRPNVPKISPSDLPSASQSAGFQEFYSHSSSSPTAAPEFTNKDGSVEEGDVLRHQYGVDARTSTSSKTTDGERAAPSRQSFGNISPPQNQMEFPHSRFENRKLPLDCMQPGIPYGGDGGGSAKISSQIQHGSFYPWMKSCTGEFSYFVPSPSHVFWPILSNVGLTNSNEIFTLPHKLSFI